MKSVHIQRLTYSLRARLTASRFFCTAKTTCVSPQADLIDRLKATSKTYYQTLSKKQMDDLREFASTTVDFSALSTKLLLFLHKVFGMHPMPNSKAVIDGIFQEYRKRLQQGDDTTNKDTVFNRFHAFCVLRAQENKAIKQRNTPGLKWIDIPSDVHKMATQLAYPEDSSAKNTIFDKFAGKKSPKPSGSPIEKISLLTAQLKFFLTQNTETDSTFKVLKTLSRLAAKIHIIMVDPVAKGAAQRSGGMKVIKEGVDTMCTLIEQRFSNKIGKIHNYEVIACLAMMHKTSANSLTMKHYKEYFLCLLSKEYTESDANEIVYVIFHAFEVARVLFFHRNPDAEEITKAVFRCCLQNENLLKEEPLSQKTLIRMSQTSISSKNKENVATCMKILCFPSFRERISSEAGTALCLVLCDLVRHKTFKSSGCTAILTEIHLKEWLPEVFL